MVLLKTYQEVIAIGDEKQTHGTSASKSSDVVPSLKNLGGALRSAKERSLYTSMKEAHVDSPRLSREAILNKKADLEGTVLQMQSKHLTDPFERSDDERHVKRRRIVALMRTQKKSSKQMRADELTRHVEEMLDDILRISSHISQCVIQPVFYSVFEEVMLDYFQRCFIEETLDVPIANYLVQKQSRIYWQKNY